MIHELNSAAQTLAQSWLAFSVVLAIQVGLVLLLRKPVRAWLGAVACYRLWLLPLLCLPFYLGGPALLEELANLSNATPRADSQGATALQQFINFELLPFDVGTRDVLLSTSGDPVVNGWLVLTLAWVLGTFAVLAWQGRRWLDFLRQVRALASPLPAPERIQCGAAAHFASNVPVLSLQGLGTAALFGVVKPAVLLPESFCRRYDGNQRHIILAHEAVHMRRGDNGWNLCALLLLALFWTNPLLLLAWRYYRFDQELSCDALALARCNPEQRKRYARTLLDSLGSLSSHTTLPGLSAWDNLGDIKERSLMIKQHLHTATRPVATLVSLLSLTVLGAALTVTFAELVSPVVQAAEPTQATQVVQQASPVTRSVIQQAPQASLATQPLPEESVRAVQPPQRVTRETPQATQAAQPVIQAGEPITQQPLQVAQAPQPLIQEVQQVAQEVQRVTQETQQVTQQIQQAAQETQPITQEVRQVAQQAAEQTEQVSREAQQVRQAPREPMVGRSRADRRDEDEVAGAGTIDEQTGRMLSRAIEFLNNAQFAEARETLGELRLNRLSPFERSRYEQLMFNLDMNDENYSGARGHMRAAIDSGGLNPQELSIVNYQLAQLYVQEEKYAEAVVALEAWLAAEATPNAGAYYLLAASQYYQNQIDAALPNAEQAVALGKSNDMHVESHYAMLAALYAQAGARDAAERVKAEMAELFPPVEASRESQPLLPIVRVNPDYPLRALSRGLEGWVAVRFTIDEAGSVIDPVVVDGSSSKAIFDDAAIDAVSRWRYNPIIEDGVAVQRAGLQTIRFMLASE